MVPTSTRLDAGLAQDLGHAEGAADLDQLAARDEHLPAAGQRRQREQHRGGAVVHGQRVLGAREQAQQAGDPGPALAALPALEVQLEGAVAGRGGGHRVRHLAGQRGPPEVGVEHHAARVHDPDRARAARDPAAAARPPATGSAGAAPRSMRGARGGQRAPRPLRERPGRQVGPRLREPADQPVHGRELAARILRSGHESLGEAGAGPALSGGSA